MKDLEQTAMFTMWMRLKPMDNGLVIPIYFYDDTKVIVGWYPLFL